MPRVTHEQNLQTVITTFEVNPGSDRLRQAIKCEKFKQITFHGCKVVDSPEPRSGN